MFRRLNEWLILRLFKFPLFFRYKIKTKGLDKLNRETLKKPGGILFLANHCSIVIDPSIVVTTISKKFSVRPIIVEYMYRLPIVKYVMDSIRALPVPDFDLNSNSLKKKKMEQVHQIMAEELRNGENFLIYPAGRTKHTGKEIIGGASAVHRLISEVPEVNVVLVRTTGLFGSMFSRAFPSHPPTVFGTMWEGAKIVLKNLIFFVPKRTVTLEFTPAPADFPWKANRQDMNKWLEDWFNKPDGLTPNQAPNSGDSIVLRPYQFWSNKLPDFQARSNAEAEIYDLKEVPPGVRQKVLEKISEISEVPVEQINPEMSMAADLGMDSMDTAEVVAFLHDEYNISNVPVIQLTSVGKLMAIAAGLVVCKEDNEEGDKINRKWFQNLPHDRVYREPGETLPEAFLNIAARLGNQMAVADDRTGVLTYKQFKMRILILADYIRTLPGEYVGIMLPASVISTALVLASQMAGKIPVMINWTVGPRHLDSVVQLTGVKTVFTSWSFTDRLENVDLTPIEDRLVMLEDIRHTFGIGAKLRAFFLSRKRTKDILNRLAKKPATAEDRAVVLFTSGTESMPKGVPLTHKNLLSNIGSYYTAVDLYHDDIFFGILPPFHSFGFAASGFLGLLAGMRTAYFPNPTEGRRLAESIQKWGVTLMCGAPTFIKGMLKVAAPGQLTTLRICVTGAEKAPPDLYALVEKMAPNATVLEGYGITECSPVLTLTRMNEEHIGVGRPMEHVEIRIVHPETHGPMHEGERGLIVAHGPNIFHGYLNPGLDSPFITLEGKTWYKTGDLGYLDDRHNLILSGRMKRFIKVGPEMVSLASIEDALLQIAHKKGWPIAQEGPTLAVCAREQEGERPRISLFTMFNVSVDEINKNLKEAGFSNLVRVSSVQQLEMIPIMGTGKINYRALESKYMA